MTLDEAMTRACEGIPGLERGAMVLLPDGFLLGATHGAGFLDLESLIRSIGRCFAPRAIPTIAGHQLGRFVEFSFVISDQLVVVQGGRVEPRLAFGFTCRREHNLAFVLAATRAAAIAIERDVDLTAWVA